MSCLYWIHTVPIEFTWKTRKEKVFSDQCWDKYSKYLNIRILCTEYLKWIFNSLQYKNWILFEYSNKYYEYLSWKYIRIIYYIWNFDIKFMLKIKDLYLLSKKTFKTCNMIVDIRFVRHNIKIRNKFYIYYICLGQWFLLPNLWMYSIF